VTAAAGPWSWSAPLHRSRCGASHQRRGVPCQDASLSASLRSADGLPVGLMAVADGHGGSRYWLSDVGSRLACELAIQLASQDLNRQPLGEGRADQLQAVQRWLATELPGRIVAAWQEAIQADWQGRELPRQHQGEPFSPQAYGSTLALVVLTPSWWGHTGLGDWDLVLLCNDQPDRIISQELDDGLQGEATESLCLARASSCFAARTAVYSLAGEQRQACGLVLTTDGVRKSCAADGDHLALSRYLLEEAQPGQAKAAGSTERLDASLDRISRDGSGDDVSVALACFGELRPAAALPELPPLPELEITAIAEEGPQTKPSNRKTRKKAAPSLLRISLLLIAGGCLSFTAWIWLRPIAHRKSTAPVAHPATDSPLPLTRPQASSINAQIKRLCNQDQTLIKSILNTRKEIPKRIQLNPRLIQQLLANSDWEGSLILLNRPDRTKPAQLSPLCPVLKQALEAYWEEYTQPESPAKINKQPSQRATQLSTPTAPQPETRQQATSTDR